MRNDMFILGLGRGWTEKVAKIQANKLLEMGHCTKVIRLNEQNFIVVYSYSGFTMKEVMEKIANAPQNYSKGI